MYPFTHTVDAAAYVAETRAAFDHLVGGYRLDFVVDAPSADHILTLWGGGYTPTMAAAALIERSITKGTPDDAF